MAIFSFSDFRCVFIGRLEELVCCTWECPPLSLFPLLNLWGELGEPGWLTWKSRLVGGVVSGEVCDWFGEVGNLFWCRLVGF